MAVTLHVHRWGDGDLRVLLLHGITSAGSGWWRVGPDLAARGWSVFAPDLRGHGESPMASSYRFVEYADDLRPLGSAWDAVVGHSMGAAIAVLAAEDRGFANRLVLQDPAVVTATDVDEVLRWLLPDFEGPMTPAWVLEQYPWYHPEDARLKVLSLRQTMPEIIEQTVRDNVPWNVLAETAALDTDTVILGSDPLAGGILPVTIGEWLATENPRITYRVLDDAPHSAHRSKTLYDAYLTALVDALEAGTKEDA
ncbi:MAG TPA: alpha/beta hydrolase [Acidimicrobiia bacterium]|nr:alpha/beta hydrolase [Acidimicrobiia bacterium]